MFVYILRRLSQTALVLAITSLLVFGGLYLVGDPVEILVNPSADQIEKDSGTIVRFGTKPVILIRTAAGEFHAFSATCTHLDCTVQYRAEKQDIWCACHNGVYDLNGTNVSGPPPRPRAYARCSNVSPSTVIVTMVSLASAMLPGCV